RLRREASRLTKTTGRLRAIDFERRSQANTATDSQYHRRLHSSRSQARRYARIVNREKSPESTSRRSVIHATDSTRRGWMANRRAVKAAEKPRAGSRSERSGRANVTSRRTRK